MNLLSVDLSKTNGQTVHVTCSGGIVHRSEEYDAYYCENCGWLEPKCSDPECEFCQNRPEVPPKRNV